MPPKKITSAPRRRGAPLGNNNAIKHGFYSRQFKKADLDALAASNSSGLKDEIAMLRLFIGRVVALGVDVDNLPEAISLLRVLCLATAGMSRLLKTEYLISGKANELNTALDEALLKAMEEFGIAEMYPP